MTFTVIVPRESNLVYCQEKRTWVRENQSNSVNQNKVTETEDIQTTERKEFDRINN